MRAAHLFVDDDPKILEDRCALLFVGTGQGKIFLEMADALHQPIPRSIRGIIVMRARFVEDLLTEAIARGVTQYVILSAGLDSFAYRRRDVEKILRIYEVDLPGTQEWKRNRLIEAGIGIPGNVVFVPIDFEKQSLPEAIAASGYCDKEPAFFSWLGATQYLTEDAVLHTLHTIVRMAAPGSQIIFQYNVPDSMLEDEDLKVREFLEKTCQEKGEPLLSAFAPGRLASMLEDMGYYEVMDFAPRDAFYQYFRGRNDGLCPHNASHLMAGRIGLNR